MAKTETTRVDRAIRWLKDNPILAPVIVVGICLSAVGAAVNEFPEPFKSDITGIFSRQKLNSGWIFLGYLNVNDTVYWDEGPYATVVGTAPEDPTRPFRVGNVIALNHDRELIIINYKNEGAKEFYSPPPAVHGILRASDHTGSIVKAGTELLVRDVWIGHFPGADYAVWVRITPAGTAD
jgi:hypothetical protein